MINLLRLIPSRLKIRFFLVGALLTTTLLMVASQKYAFKMATIVKEQQAQISTLKSQMARNEKLITSYYQKRNKQVVRLPQNQHWDSTNIPASTRRVLTTPSN